MEIAQVISVALIAAFALVLLRQVRPEVAIPLSVLASVVILVFVLRQIGAVVRLASDLLNEAGVNTRYADSLFKIIGIAYLTEFGAQICRDAGEGALGAKVELAGKVFILLLAVPIVIAIVETLLGVLPL